MVDEPPPETRYFEDSLSQVWISKTRVESGGISMTREFQTFRLATQPRRIWLLALGLALSPLFSAQSWAETYDLQSVDFATAGDKTNIILHTGSIVPVQKVLVSDNKLILEIDQVNTDETVHTNFSGASNISHVIMQPIDEHKIRMIIRGEGLGTPSVAFYSAGNGAYSSANPDFDANRLNAETHAALRNLQEIGTQPATLQTANTKPIAEQPAVDTTKPLQEEEPIAFGGFVDTNNKSAIATQPAPTMGKLNQLPDSAPLPLQPGSATAGNNGFFEQVAGGKYNGYLPYGLLTLLLLGIGGFVGHKIIRMKQGAADLEDLIEEQAQGKRVSFREMADAYRSKHEARQSERGTSSKASNRKLRM
jgi:RecB family exonuclease